MATFGIESGSVDNRSFSSSTGYGKKFKDWVVKTPSNHGPGWYIWDDQSGIGTDPYIVVCNQASPTVNSKAIFIRFIVLSATENIYFYYYLWWNASTQVGVANYQANQITTKTGSFAYYFRGGVDFLMCISRDGLNIYHARLSRWVGIWDGSKGTEPESTSGVLTANAFLSTDPGGYLGSYHLITGYKASLDGAGKLYFSIVLVSGTTYFINIYKDSARTLLVGHTATFTNTTTGVKNITLDNSSGLGGSINTVITVSAATNIDCRFNRLDLGSGQGANFRVNKFYFLIDFTGDVQRIRYVKVESKSGDQIVIDSPGPLNFGVGAYISPYPHRWVATGSNSLIDNSSHFPYVSNQGSEMPGVGSTNQRAGADWMPTSLSVANPDDEGDFACMYLWWVESQNNRIWGKETNVLICGGNGMANMTDRRIVGAIPYICFASGTIATVVLDQESLT